MSSDKSEGFAAFYLHTALRKWRLLPPSHFAGHLSRLIVDVKLRLMTSGQNV